MNKGNLISKPAAKELDALSELHKALGDYTRIRILWLLMERELAYAIMVRQRTGGRNEDDGIGHIPSASYSAERPVGKRS